MAPGIDKQQMFERILSGANFLPPGTERMQRAEATRKLNTLRLTEATKALNGSMKSRSLPAGVSEGGNLTARGGRIHWAGAPQRANANFG